ncbi:hypothetical protein BD413DRAFT_41725 [Trametes elegans]|nr:hypothetical protein BD413DRAFT_41725 [Trametes elegans]
MMTQLGPNDGHVPGNILAALCVTNTTGEYHWLIYVCTGKRDGVKLHAHDEMNTGPWRYHCGPWNAMDSITCVALTKVGCLPSGKTPEDVHNIVKDIEMAVPDVDRPRFGNRFTCLVWFRAAIRTLHRERILGVTDIDRLEQSLRELATAMEFRRLAGLQGSNPRPTVMAPSDFTY